MVAGYDVVEIVENTKADKADKREFSPRKILPRKIFNWPLVFLGPAFASILITHCGELVRKDDGLFLGLLFSLLPLPFS